MTLSDAVVSYEFQELEPSEPPPRDAAARALALAAEEAEQIREQARSHGYGEGHAQGRADALAEMDGAIAALREAAGGVGALRAQVADAVERDAVDLALALAGKILAGNLQARPEAVLDVVQGALRRVTDRRGLAVLVNPTDLETILGALGEGRISAKGFELSDLQPDQRVPPGGAIVHTVEGEIDAGVETQLERAREVVATELSGGGDGL